MSQWLPFALFAFVASITPGPTNILALSNSSRFGALAAVPIILGAGTAAAAIVLRAGLGAGEWLLRHPQLQQSMTWIGLGWLLYLAWQIASGPADPLAATATTRRLGALGAAGLQLVNPKTWMMAFAVVSVFTGTDANAGRYLIHALLFFLIALPGHLGPARARRGEAAALRRAHAGAQSRHGAAAGRFGGDESVERGSPWSPPCLPAGAACLPRVFQPTPRETQRHNHSHLDSMIGE